MSATHITYFKVSNFKKFDTLELKEIGQFNLIVGDNNVGKSSLLEALLFEENPNAFLLNLTKVLQLRGIELVPHIIFGNKGETLDLKLPTENFLSYLTKNLNKRLEFEVTFSDLPKQYIELLIKNDPPKKEYNGEFFMDSPEENNITTSNWKWDDRFIEIFHLEKVSFEDKSESGFFKTEAPEVFYHTIIQGLYEHMLFFDNKLPQIPLITTTPALPAELPSAYFEQVNLSRKEKVQLINNMQFILPDIEDFEVRKINGQDHLMIGMNGKDDLMPISMFGESVIRSTYLLLQIAKNKGKRLMIDEVDTGIHHTRLKNFLKTLFQVAEKYEVQLFMTTHSLECQQAFVDAMSLPEMEQSRQKARNITLFEKPDKQVSARIFNFEEMKFALETGFEIRGE